MSFDVNTTPNFSTVRGLDFIFFNSLLGVCARDLGLKSSTADNRPDCRGAPWGDVLNYRMGPRPGALKRAGGRKEMIRPVVMNIILRELVRLGHGDFLTENKRTSVGEMMLYLAGTMQLKGATDWQVIGIDEKEPIGGQRSASPIGGGRI
jgi:hypothetical protein